MRASLGGHLKAIVHRKPSLSGRLASPAQVRGGEDLSDLAKAFLGGHQVRVKARGQ
jgi:hypothetical protein